MASITLFKKKTETKKVKFVQYDDFDQCEVDEIKDDIYERFLRFRSLLLNNQVDFTKLQEYDLAFLRACNLNLGLQLASGYTCSIERLSSSMICYRINQIEVNNKKISYNLGKLENKEWSSFRRISVEERDIKVYDAVLNMARESRLPLVCKEPKFLKEVKELTTEILNELNSSTSTSEAFDETESLHSTLV